MKVYNTWKGIKQKYDNIFLGLGNFDGVHLGHQRLLSDMVNSARDKGYTAMVFTFYPHPMVVLKPQSAPPMLLSRRAKQAMMSKLGVDVLLEVPFTSELASMSPEDFMERVLYQELAVKSVFVGYNYTFGRGGAGSPDTLFQGGIRYNFNVNVTSPVTAGEVAISSTLIRGLIAAGDVEEARKYLGYCPFVEGPVVTGEMRGRTLGFPTANLNVDENTLLPPNGVYAVKVGVDGEQYLGVANIGVKPTFHKALGRRNLEVHLLDFCSDLYGRQIKVYLKRKLRDEKRFSSPTELIEQINFDISRARSVEAYE